MTFLCIKFFQRFKKKCETNYGPDICRPLVLVNTRLSGINVPFFRALIKGSMPLLETLMGHCQIECVSI